VSDFFRELNRPALLARRDAAVEQAVETLYRPVQSMDTQGRLAHVNSILALLKTALVYADRAAHSERATQKEKDFRRFLELVLGNVESVEALIRNQAHFQSEQECFLSQFLGSDAEAATLSATNFQRRSEDMLHGLWQILRLSHAPYRALQAENLASLTAEERERYERGYGRYLALAPDAGAVTGGATAAN
jgi:hypothetical protein